MAVIAGIPLGATTVPTAVAAPLDVSSFGAPFFATEDGSLAIVKVLTNPTLLVVAFPLLMSDFFDTMGTAMAVAKQDEFLTEDGNVEDIREILLVDSAAAAAGGFFGVSSITTFVESASGAADGGRTGLTSIYTGVLFLLTAAAFWCTSWWLKYSSRHGSTWWDLYCQLLEYVYTRNKRSVFVGGKYGFHCCRLFPY